jgi:hypothetical protein
VEQKWLSLQMQDLANVHEMSEFFLFQCKHFVVFHEPRTSPGSSIKRCCYITVDSATTALQNGACTYQCISNQMHYKTPFTHNGYMKSLEFYDNYITLFCLEKTNFLTVLYYIKSEPCMADYPKWLNNYLV